jgi:hypothetical protein
VEVVTGGGQTVVCGGAAGVEIRGICRAVTLSTITTATTAQINCVTGPIGLTGTDGTVNIYGVCGAVTDSRTGTPVLSNAAVSQATVNAEVDSALNTAIPGSPTADSINERVATMDAGVTVAAAGLDAITVTAPTGKATTFPAMVVQLFRRFFGKATLTATTLTLYNDATPVTTQTVSNTGGTETQGEASDA